MPFVIAVDYDGTLFDKSYPEIGDPITEVINKVKQFIDNGAEVVLWTCRDGENLKQAVDRCSDQGIKFTAINDNSPSDKKYQEMRAKDGQTFGKRKIFADLYVDDHAPGSIEYFLNLDVFSECERFEKRSF